MLYTSYRFFNIIKQTSGSLSRAALVDEVDWRSDDLDLPAAMFDELVVLGKPGRALPRIVPADDHAGANGDSLVDCGKHRIATLLGIHIDIRIRHDKRFHCHISLQS